MANVFYSVTRLVSCCQNPVYAESLEFIDAQAHFDPANSDLKGLLERMLRGMDRQEILEPHSRHQVKPSGATLS
jgi:hypothetical protein